MTLAELPLAPTTSGAETTRDRIPGFVTARQLQESPVYFRNGPTGRSLIWPETLSALMHEFSTTDPGFNRVDYVWIRDGTVVFIELKVSEKHPADDDHSAIRPLDEVVTSLRAQLGMSAEDVAAMCGVGRRQLYNLMSGNSTGTAQEAHMRRLGQLVDQLSEVVENSAQRVRSVVLHPIEGTSLYDAAVSQDSRTLDSLGRQLIELVRTGQLAGAIRRPSPRRRAYARPGAIAETFGDDGSES